MSEAFDFKKEYENLEFLDPKTLTTIYGPIKSRRFGLSLGINLFSTHTKVCSFDCVYCDLGTTQVRLNKVKKDGPFVGLEDLKSELQKAGDFLKSSPAASEIQAISISGNGEPTLYPQLNDAIEMLIQFRNMFLPKAKLYIFTNGVQIDSKKHIDSVQKLDGIVFKLDAGSDEAIKKINKPLVKTYVDNLILSSKAFSKIIIQSTFIKGTFNNMSPQNLEEWIEVIGMIKPQEVHIMSIHHVPSYSGIILPTEDDLYTIVSKLDRKTGIKAKVF